MKIKLLAGSLAFAGALTAGATNAAVYHFDVQGSVSAIYSANGSFIQTPNPPSVILQGDPVEVTFDLDTSSAEVTSLYDADPTINIYNGSVLNFTAKAGSYILHAPPSSSSFATIQLWNDYLVGGTPNDSFSIDVVQPLSGHPSPFDVGLGPASSVFGLNAFDPTATARINDLISSITSLSGFSEQTAFLGFINTTTNQQTNFQISDLVASVSLSADSRAINVGDAVSRYCLCRRGDASKASLESARSATATIAEDVKPVPKRPTAIVVQ